MYHTTETAQCADLILPAAGWGEKEGTFINSERRIGAFKKVADAPGEAKSDFAIFQLIAQYWGCRDLFEDWDSPAAVFQILKQLSCDHPCDFSGIVDEQMLDEQGGIQWPLPENATNAATHRRLFEDGVFYHPGGRARFIFEAPRPLTEPPSERFPLLLLHRAGERCPVAHRNAHRQVCGVARLVPQALGRGDQSCGRPAVRHQPQRLGLCRVAARTSPSAGIRHADDRLRPGLPAHARRGDQPPDRCGL